VVPTTIEWLIVFAAQWVVIFYPGVLVFWAIFHPNIERWRKIGTPAYWVAAFSWGVTALPILFFRREIFAVRWEIPGVAGLMLWVIGAVLGVIGALFYFGATQQITIKTMVGFPELKPQENPQRVLRSGVYAKTRNPLYFGYWLGVLSLALLTNFVASWILFAINCIFLPFLIRAEEHELLARLGSDYAAYMKRVPRFFPHLS
jgi:protein-S-isoprenylcysteine O-methyltransferase Ste14